jgi:hypothetical protein
MNFIYHKISESLLLLARDYRFYNIKKMKFQNTWPVPSSNFELKIKFNIITKTFIDRAYEL